METICRQLPFWHSFGFDLLLALALVTVPLWWWILQNGLP
ncbi:putative membrane protein [Synechococcus sp. RS9909]|nr:putative membrane protein [Synechococcus sp. RS9909]